MPSDCLPSQIPDFDTKLHAAIANNALVQVLYAH